MEDVCKMSNMVQIPLWTIRTIYPIMPAVTTAGSDSSMDDKDGSQVYLRQYGFGSSDSSMDDKD